MDFFGRVWIDLDEFGWAFEGFTSRSAVYISLYNTFSLGFYAVLTMSGLMEFIDII